MGEEDLVTSPRISAYEARKDLNGTKVLVSKEIAVLRRQASLKLIKENLTIPAP